MTAAEKRIIADKYEILGVLGEGGTGVVYDAATSDGRAIALKVMHPTLAGDKQIRGRFQREAEILRRLEGAHVCPILDFGEVPGGDPGATLLYIALPKIEGVSLAERLAKGPIERERALDTMLEVLDALASAHAQGIIHRDLKPANVLLERSKDDQREHVVVVDFGMSKIVTGAGLGTTNLTTHNMVFGTPEYMSPEQAKGDELDARCDVYAAGVMLYEMMTGSLPFTGKTPLSVLTAHLTEELEPPSKRSTVDGRITPALESVILNALARDRDKRYASAAALAAALRHARAMPADVASLTPAAFSSAPPAADAFAATMPGSTKTAVSLANAPTMVSQTPVVAAPPVEPVPKAPSRPPSGAPVAAAPEPSSHTRLWILAWVIVGLASISLGVYFALK